MCVCVCVLGEDVGEVPNTLIHSLLGTIQVGDVDHSLPCGNRRKQNIAVFFIFVWAKKHNRHFGFMPDSAFLD